jgi:hypothetical protein
VAARPAPCRGNEVPHQDQERRTTETRSHNATALRPLGWRWSVDQRASREWISNSNSPHDRNTPSRSPVGRRLVLECRLRSRSMSTAWSPASGSSLERRFPAAHNHMARRAQPPGGPPGQSLRAARELVEWRTSCCRRTLDTCDRTINSKKKAVAAIPPRGPA